MKHYKCQKCEFIFSDAEKVVSVAAPDGSCPKCSYVISYDSGKLDAYKIKHEPEAQMVLWGENINAFKCYNCNNSAFLKHAGHVPFLSELGFIGFLKFGLSRIIDELFWKFFKVLPDKNKDPSRKICQNCVSQVELTGLILLIIRLFVIYMLLKGALNLDKFLFKLM
jgi:hypothetical protein